MKTLEEMLTVDDVGTLTLEEGMELYAAAISGIRDELLDGGIWTPRVSGALCKTFVILDRLLSYLAQATGAHSRLRYWMAQNGYATGLPMELILRNYTHGSILLRELIDALSLAIEYAEEWREKRAEENELKNPSKSSR